MKALTLWEPWATLVVHGAKLFETRPWSTLYTGRLAIHAAKHWTEELEGLCFTDPFHRALLQCLDAGSPVPRHRGCILGTVRLVGCHMIDGRFSTTVGYAHGRQELEFGNWEPGRVAWELRDPEVLDQPVPWRGQQGLWELPKDWREQGPTGGR